MRAFHRHWLATKPRKETNMRGIALAILVFSFSAELRQLREDGDNNDSEFGGNLTAALVIACFICIIMGW